MNAREAASPTYNAPSAPADTKLKIGRLEVKFDAAASTRSRSLYANGRMQVKVLVLISGLDEHANEVALPNDVLSTVKLIHYNGSQPLANDEQPLLHEGRPLFSGWASSKHENNFVHEISGAFERMAVEPADAEVSLPHVLTFWVSTTRADSTQVAAEVTVEGQVFRSNRTGTSVGRDSSLTLIGKLPVTYPMSDFILKSHKGPLRIFDVHTVGLFPAAEGRKQIPLVGGELRLGVLAGIALSHSAGVNTKNPLLNILDDDKEYMGRSGSLLSDYFDSLVGNNQPQSGRVDVLSCIYKLSSVHRNMASPVYFSLIDVYGTEHWFIMRLVVVDQNGERVDVNTPAEEFDDDHDLNGYLVVFDIDRV